MKDTENSKSGKTGEGFLHRLIRKRHVENLKEIGHDVETSKVGIRFALKNGGRIQPDIIDWTAKEVWEILNKGDKRDIVFDNLPDGWGGGYIFISNNNCTKDYIYKPDGDMKEIDWN